MRVHKLSDILFKIINTSIMWFVIIVTLYPFLHVLIISLSPIEDVMKYGFVFPSRIDLSSYKYAFSTGAIQNSYLVTIFIVVVGTSLNMLLTSLGGFVLSKPYLPFRKPLTIFVIITMLFSGGLIPLYLVVRGLGLIDSVWSVIIPTLVSTYNLIIMKNFFQTVPVALEESAQIDGCSYIKLLISVYIPLSAPVLATLTLFYAVGHWNAFFFAYIFINDKNLWPLQVIVREILVANIEPLTTENAPPPLETLKMATIIICTVPILFVYPFLQRYFVKGVMIGSIKG